eukprot:364602-Chlamydomonas_euryale.AAC.16
MATPTGGASSTVNDPAPSASAACTSLPALLAGGGQVDRRQRQATPTGGASNTEVAKSIDASGMATPMGGASSTISDLTAIGEGRGTVLGIRLDRMADSVTGQALHSQFTYRVKMADDVFSRVHTRSRASAIRPLSAGFDGLDPDPPLSNWRISGHPPVIR